MNGQMKTFTVRFVSDRTTVYFVLGDEYEAFLPLDNQSGKIYGVVDRFGEVGGFPSSWFEKVGIEHQRVQ